MRRRLWLVLLLVLTLTSAAVAGPREWHRRLMHQVLTDNHWQLLVSDQERSLYIYRLPFQGVLLLGCHFDPYGLYRFSVATPAHSVWHPDYAGALAAGYTLLQIRLSTYADRLPLEKEFASRHIPRKAVIIVQTVLDTLKNSASTRFPFDGLLVQGERHTQKDEAWFLITLTLR